MHGLQDHTHELVLQNGNGEVWIIQRSPSQVYLPLCATSGDGPTLTSLRQDAIGAYGKGWFKICNPEYFDTKVGGNSLRKSERQEPDDAATTAKLPR